MTMAGVRGVDTAEQLRFVAGCCRDYARKPACGTLYAEAVARNGEPGFGPFEAMMLYGFVRTHRPGKIVQVGCGVSTALALRAAQDAGYTPEIVCIEPYPTTMLREEGRAGRVRLIPEKAQKVALHELTDLSPGDLLFVDSTHTVKVGSEVVRVILEALPRLPVGSYAHFHDITFPFDYSPGILRHELFMWRETTLLHAFLAMNPSYEIAASLSMLHHADPEGLRGVFPGYSPMVARDGLEVAGGDFPSSTYIRRIPEGAA
jgi:hypothetical protein